MEIIKYLGNKLAEQINISAPAARGLLKLSIKDELGPFKDLNQLNYEELSLVLKNSLKNRLINLKVNDQDHVINKLLNELTLNQSLITMAGVSL
ncbi:MAG: hypothetical protein EU539_12535 [Promethearchaeota archaeon]|nr:MAG: hypothetical protein EU539_12535 [Candidatus Lokiarchaeota archaeon]